MRRYESMRMHLLKHSTLVKKTIKRIYKLNLNNQLSKTRETVPITKACMTWCSKTIWPIWLVRGRVLFISKAKRNVEMHLTKLAQLLIIIWIQLRLMTLAKVDCNFLWPYRIIKTSQDSSISKSTPSKIKKRSRKKMFKLLQMFLGPTPQRKKHRGHLQRLNWWMSTPTRLTTSPFKRSKRTSLTTSWAHKGNLQCPRHKTCPKTSKNETKIWRWASQLPRN